MSWVRVKFGWIENKGAREMSQELEFILVPVKEIPINERKRGVTPKKDNVGVELEKRYYERFFGRFRKRRKKR